MSRFIAVTNAIDTANEADPTSIRFGGTDHPRAAIEGRRAQLWLDHLRPDAADPLRLAARAHHIRRWEVPRDSYPRTRAGYLEWRSGLYEFHATVLGDLMRATGYQDGDLAAAARVMTKRGIKTDQDTQSYEDAVSLAFLEVRLVEFAPSVDDDQLMTALRRTWRKMSEAGRQAASSLELDEDMGALIARALDRGRSASRG